MIIAGFPGVGKTHYYQETILNVADSDSSEFSWEKPGVRHPDFPDNYIKHIKFKIGGCHIILVSTHEIVRKALQKHKLNYILVYPERNLKESYIDRYVKRGSPQAFVDFLSKSWDTFIDQMEEDKSPSCVLKESQFLSDIILM